VKTDLQHPAGEWRAGWKVVLTAALGMSLVTMYSNSAGVVMKPLQEAFGWSRGQISSMTAIKSTVIILASPLVGWAVDRFGSRRIAIPGVAAYCSAIALVGFTGPSIWSWYLAWTVAAFAGVLVGSTVWTAAVASRFARHRGLAISATLCGLGATSAVVPAYATWALGAFGWRGVYFSLGALGLVAALPMAVLFFREAPRQPGAGRSAADPNLPGFTFAQAIRQPRYWRLAAALCTSALSAGAFQLHLVPMMTDAGISRVEAAAYVGLIGPVSIASRLVGGFLMDRLHPPLVAGGCFALPIIACLLIPYLGVSPAVPLAVVLIDGLGAGGAGGATGVMVSRYFGMKSYGRSYAILTALVGVGYGYAGLLAGVMYDRYGSYDMLLKVLVACLAIGAGFMLTMGRAPNFPSDA
jgi:predicted MFS family arabinose efflux permease